MKHSSTLRGGDPIWKHPLSDQNKKSKRRNGDQTKGNKLTPAQQSEVARMLSSQLKQNIETKVTYVAGSSTYSNSGTIVDLFSNLIRGDLPLNQFQGSLVKPSGLRVRFTWSTNQSFSTVRTLIFQWKDATVPLPSGILNSTGSVQSPNSPLFWTNVHKIHVLYDKSHALKPRVASGYDACYLDTGILGGLSTVQFAVSSTNPQMNGIYMLLISDDALVSFPACTWYSEIRFTDA